MNCKLRKCLVLCLLLVLSVSLVACNDAEIETTSGKEQENVNYEEWYRWEGNMISGLSAKGRKQTKLVIPARCEGFVSTLFVTHNTPVEEIIFEGDADLNIDVQFAYMETLKRIELPDGLTQIPLSALAMSTSLETIVIPEKVTEIGDFALERSVSLHTVEFRGNELKVIGSNAFDGCTALKQIVLPDSVETIGDKAFYNCKALTKFTLPKSTRNIGSAAFMNCGITELFVPAEVELENVGDAAFAQYENTVTVHVVEGSWMDLHFDEIFDNTYVKTYQ